MQTNGDTDMAKPVGEFLSTFSCEQAKNLQYHSANVRKKKTQQ
jgi:hypothetical protein